MAADRRDDWHNSVDERLVNLNSAQGSTDVELANVEKELTRIDNLLRGDRDAHITGLIESLRETQKEINKFNSIFDKDYLGHGGLISFITYLHNQEKERDKRAGYKWGYLGTATVVLGTIITSTIGLIGYLIINWAAVSNHLKPSPPKKIERARHPKPRKTLIVIPKKEAPDDDVRPSSPVP